MEEANKITPTIDQMRHLQKLGDKCEDASMVYHPVTPLSEIFKLEIGNIEFKREFWNNPKRRALVGENYFDRMYGRDVPAYTADDLALKIPEVLNLNGHEHCFIMSKMPGIKGVYYMARYAFVDCHNEIVSLRDDVTWTADSIVQLLYMVYVWYINFKQTEYN